jgi:hypothetical protein
MTTTRHPILSALSYANVMATAAVFLALGGGAYAAMKLPTNSVGRQQIRRDAVNSAKVRNGSLLAADFRAGQLPARAAGPKGDKGDPGANGRDGAPGVARAYAYIKPDGSLDTSRSSNVIASVRGGNGSPTLGDYCIKLGFTPKSVIATPRVFETGNAGGVTATASARYLPDPGYPNDCPADYSEAGGAQVLMIGGGRFADNAVFLLFN